MRPSCQSAKPWPCSAAYCSDITARVFSPVLSASVALRIASTGDIARVGACGGDGVPSSAGVGSIPKASAITAGLARALNIRIGRLLGGAARMGDRAMQRVPHLLGVFPDVTGSNVALARLPGLAALRKLGFGNLHIQGAFDGVDLDDVAVANQRDRAADRGLRTDMADAEAPGRAGEPAVGDQRHLAAGALTVQRSGGRQHLTHARTALGTLVTNDEHVAFLVLARPDRGEGVILAVKAARRTGEFQLLHAGHFHDRALGRE